MDVAGCGVIAHVVVGGCVAVVCGVVRGVDDVRVPAVVYAVFALVVCVF